MVDRITSQEEQKITLVNVGDDTSQQKPKRVAPYSELSIRETGKGAGIRLDELRTVPIDQMLADAKLNLKWADAIKKVYGRLVEYLAFEGFPTEASAGFGAKVGDLVLCVIGLMLSYFSRKTGRKILLEREKEVISIGNETGRIVDFVVVDRVSMTKEESVLVMEAKGSCLGEGINQCLLSLKDARDNDCGGEVYGFTTTGKSWRMIKYDGKDFLQTHEIHLFFEGMDQERDLWLNNYSDLADCMYLALFHGRK